MRILNLGCADDTYGTDFIDLFPQRSEIKKCDINKEKLPYQDNTFDEVFCRQMIMYVYNNEHFIKEIHRVLKPGGKLYLTSASADYYGSSYWYNGFQNEKGHKAHPYSLHTKTTLKNIIELAPFKNVNVHYGFVPMMKTSTIIMIGYYRDKILSRNPNVIGNAIK